MRRRSGLLAAALLAPALACAATGADRDFELRCQREMQPVLEVQARMATFDVSNTVSSRVLNTRSIHASVSQRTLGLTAGSARTEITFDAPGLVGGRRECVSPRIWVDLRYDPLHVYVAREFSTRSCAYRTVYEHEMQHVQLYRNQLPLLEEAVRAQLARRYGNHPLYAPAGRGLDLLAADVDNWLRPLIQAELARVEAQQVLLDTPEETFRLSHACGGEIASAVGSSI